MRQWYFTFYPFPVCVCRKINHLSCFLDTGNACFLCWGVTNKRTVWLTGLCLPKKTHMNMWPYIKLNDECSIFLQGEKNNKFLSPHVVKGVSSHRDARNGLTKFRIDVLRCADTLLEIFSARWASENSRYMSKHALLILPVDSVVCL